MQDKRELDFREWFKFGDRDIITARILANNNAPTENIAFFLQQASEKCLKGYLIAHGWKLKKIHDLEFLINEASKYDATFNEFLGFSRIISGVYVESRYPTEPFQDYSPEEISDWLQQTEKLINKIKEVMK